MGCHFLLQGIFPTQGSNLCFLRWQVGSSPLSHLENVTNHPQTKQHKNTPLCELIVSVDWEPRLGSAGSSGLRLHTGSGGTRVLAGLTRGRIRCQAQFPVTVEFSSSQTVGWRQAPGSCCMVSPWGSFIAWQPALSERERDREHVFRMSVRPLYPHLRNDIDHVCSHLVSRSGSGVRPTLTCVQSCLFCDASSDPPASRTSPCLTPLPSVAGPPLGISHFPPGTSDRVCLAPPGLGGSLRCLQDLPYPPIQFLLPMKDAGAQVLGFVSISVSPWRRQWHPTSVFLPGESHGRRSLVGCRHGVAQSRT